MIVEPKLIGVVGAEPVSLADAKAHLRVDGADEDGLITALISAAREHCERFTGFSLAPKTLEIAFDKWPYGAVELPGGPVREIVSVTAAGETVDPGTYLLDDYVSIGRVVPVLSWNTVNEATNTVKIRYSAGYGDGGQPLPGPIRAAMLLVVGHLFEHREAVSERGAAEMPLGVEALLRPYRVRLGMA